MDNKIAQKIYMNLEKQVEQAQKTNKPIDSFVKQQIKLLEEVHDDFVSDSMKDEALQNSIDIAGVKIKQLQAIASLCKKIGLSTQKYDNKIREIREQFFGADFVKERWGE